MGRDRLAHARGMAISMHFRLFALVGGFLSLVAGVALAIWVYSADARGQIEKLAAANRDATRWTLAQAEVELLALKVAMLEAVNAGAEQVDASLPNLRQRFDIFYSRIATFRSSQTVAELREDHPTVQRLTGIEAYLDRIALLMDGSDEGLVAALDDLVVQLADIRRLTREVSIEGVHILARSSDLQRERVVFALRDLGLIVLLLFAALVAVVIALSVMFNASRAQGVRIAATRNRLQAIIGTSIDAIVVATASGRILDFNGAASRLYGYTQAEAIGADLVQLLVPRDQHARCTALLRRLQSHPDEPMQIEPVEATARHSDGHVFPVEVAISSAMSARGPVVVVFIRDISNRIAAQQELIHARDQAVAGERVKARMLAVMSHEMRTPLNGVLGTLELLKLTSLTRMQRHYLGVMEQSGRMLLGHVNDVLEVSRGEAGQISLLSEPFAPVEVARDVVDALDAQAGLRGNRIVLRISGPASEKLIGDQGRITQILMNLIGNAIKFTSDGLITLDVECSDDTGSLEYRVTDTGIGIAKADQTRIFDEFVTLDTEYNRRVEGTGLGLPIVKRLVRLMGGRVEVDSLPGHGSTFRVILQLPRVTAQETEMDMDKDMDTDLGAGVPVRSQSAEAADAEVTADVVADADGGDAAGKPGKVLLVEDNAINRLVAREMLVRSGYRVTEAEDGSRGVEIAGKEVFDLILMDISMPVMDGIEATGQIRRGGPNSATPIVAVTAHALPDDLARFDAAGMSGALTKPLSIEQLRETLRGVLQPRGDRAAPSDTAPVYCRLAEVELRLADTVGAEAARALALRAMKELSQGIAALPAHVLLVIDAEALAANAHRLAGTAAVAGLADVHGKLAEIELLAKATQPVPEADALRQLIDEARAALANDPSAKPLRVAGSQRG
jgi:PAS domain S-box-containing protein